MQRTETNKQMENFQFKLDKKKLYMHVTNGNGSYCLYVMCAPKFSSGLTLEGHKDRFGIKSIEVKINQEQAEVQINSLQKMDKLDISFTTHSKEKIAVRKYKSLYSPCLSVHLYSASVEGEDFQKLQNNPCIITFRIKYSKYKGHWMGFTCSYTSANNSNYLKSLEVDLKKYPSSFSKDKVLLRVNEETEIVNKALLCARSSVFARMFDNDMREQHQNTIIFTDVKMPVLRALVSFLSTGFLMERDVAVLCDLYYVADKYDVWELHQACIEMFLTKINFGNILRVLKLSSLHNDELLKSAAMILISANIKTILLTSQWKELMLDDPQMALEASTFFDF